MDAFDTATYTLNMHFSLRSLLIAVAVLATVVAGLRDAFAEARSAAIAISADDASPLDGSREDDSGTPSEQMEEDDSEEESGRELHLVATSHLSSELRSCGSGLALPCPVAAPSARGSVSFSRGPPPAR